MSGFVGADIRIDTSPLEVEFAEFTSAEPPSEDDDEGISIGGILTPEITLRIAPTVCASVIVIGIPILPQCEDPPPPSHSLASDVVTQALYGHTVPTSMPSMIQPRFHEEARDAALADSGRRQRKQRQVFEASTRVGSDALLVEIIVEDAIEPLRNQLDEDEYEWASTIDTALIDDELFFT